MTIDSLLVGGGLGGLVGGQLAGRGWRAAKEEEEGGGSLLLGLEAVLGHLEVACTTHHSTCRVFPLDEMPLLT